MRELQYDEQTAETINLSDEGINLTAFWSRVLCDCMTGNERFDPIEVMENIIPLFDQSFNYRVVEKRDWIWGDSIAAFYKPERNEISIRQDVYDGAMAGNPMDVVTVAHEVAHCIQSIAFRFLRAIDCVDFKTELCSADSNELEHHELQTDRIAFLVLFPEHLIEGMSDDEIIKVYFINPLMQLLCGVIKMAGKSLSEALSDMTILKEVERCAV